MIDFLLSLITESIWPYVAGIGAAIAAVFGVYFKGRSDAKARAKVKEAEAELQAHERMNDAETGATMSDAQRVAWLRELAKQLRS